MVTSLEQCFSSFDSMRSLIDTSEERTSVDNRIGSFHYSALKKVDALNASQSFLFVTLVLGYGRKCVLNSHPEVKGKSDFEILVRNFTSAFESSRRIVLHFRLKVQQE